MTVRIALCHSCVELTTVGLKGWIACFTGQGQMCQLYLNNYSNHLNHSLQGVILRRHWNSFCGP